jgi:hypothetical protein
MSAKTLQSSISVLITGQLSKLNTKIDRYHKEVQTGFTEELRQTIDVLHIERRETINRHDKTLTSLKKELTERDKTLDGANTIIRDLEIKGGIHLETKQRLSDLEKRWTSQSQELKTCIELTAQMPWLKQSLVAKTRALDELTVEQARLRMSHTSLKQELNEREKVLSNSNTIIRDLEIKEAIHMDTQHRLSALEQRCESQSDALNISKTKCMALSAQIPWLQKALTVADARAVAATQTLEKLNAEHISLVTSVASLEADIERLRIANDMLPKLQETSRWFHHFLPNLDIDALTSMPTIGRAQEIATHSLLKNIFGDQFYAIDLVSNERHSTDIRIQAEQSGPIVLVEVKTYIPNSKGTVRNGKKMHDVPSSSGRQKLIDDLGLHRLNGCLAGIMIVHKNQYIPNIPILSEDTIVVDPEHSHIFYAQHSSAHIRKTVIAAVLYAYAIWGKNRASEDYEGRIAGMTRLLTEKNRDAISALAGICIHVDKFGKQHKLRTSEAAAIGINLRSIKDAVADAKRLETPAPTRRKRSRDVV